MRIASSTEKPSNRSYGYAISSAPLPPVPRPGRGALISIRAAFDRLDLQLDHLAIPAALVHQIGVRALLDDAAMVENDDAIGVHDGAEAVGDDEARPVGHQGLQACLDEPLAVRVQVAGGLVQDQDPRVGQQWPGRWRSADAARR